MEAVRRRRAESALEKTREEERKRREVEEKAAAEEAKRLAAEEEARVVAEQEAVAAAREAKRLQEEKARAVEEADRRRREAEEADRRATEAAQAARLAREQEERIQRENSRRAAGFSGYAYKKGGSKRDSTGTRPKANLFSRRNWNKRYFTLDGESSTLRWFKDGRPSGNEPLGNLMLVEAVVNRHVHKDREHVLSIDAPGREGFLFSCDTEGTLAEWIEQFSLHSRHSVTDAGPLPGTPSSGGEMGDDDDEEEEEENDDDDFDDAYFHDDAAPSRLLLQE